MPNEQTMLDGDAGEHEEDKRLERLFDYTKWHIGIYLGIGSGLVGLLGSKDGNEFVGRLILFPEVMLVAIFTMAVAGLAGGVIASAATRTRSFDHLWTSRQRVYCCRTFTGKVWAAIEHTAFWLSLVLFASSILWGRVFANTVVASPVSPPCCVQVVQCPK